MPSKPKRNRNDVQTAIATAAIVTTLGLWNLFAIPEKTVTVQAKQPTLPPTDPPLASEPSAMPQVKIMFTQMAPQIITPQQQQPEIKKKKKKNNNNNNGVTQSVTQTKSS
jgi:hypothetical protein